MKILCISTERDWHGGEQQLWLLIEGARRRGHEIQIVARRGSKFAKVFRQNGFSVVELTGNVRGLMAVWSVCGAIRQNRPDVVFANDPHAASLMRMAACLSPGPALVAARRVLFPIRSISRYNGCDAVVCVSEAIAKVCKEGGVDSSVLQVVRDGVDPARMTGGDRVMGRQSIALANGAPLLLSVAQLAPYKGHRYLIKAMPAVLAARPDAVLALAGDGPLRGELETLAQSLGLSKSIRFLGYRRDIPNLMAACDLFVLASPEEGLGTSVLDALFAGRPVVGANAGGIPEMLRDGSGDLCGWLAEPRDPAALANAIGNALDDVTEVGQRTARGMAHATQHFTAPKMVQQTLDIFSQVAARRITA